MAIQNDFTIYPKTKVIRHNTGATTVYTAVQFYSYLMDTFDEPGYLTYQTPMSFNTPTSFTMQNRWFLDNGDESNVLQYLTGGGIDTTGYDATAAGTDPIYMLDLVSTTDFQTTDLDAEITDDATPVGPLLAYKNDYPTANRARIWVRDTRATPATIGAGSAIATTGAGNGAGTVAATNGFFQGNEIYHNLFTIASFPTDVQPQVYIYQKHPVTADSYSDRVRIVEWSAFTNWDRGSIDILVPVQLGGSLIDSGNIKSFVRQSADTYTFVESTLNTSGRTPIATETAADEVNITKGEHYLLFDGSDAGSFEVDDVIQNVSTSSGTPPAWYAEVAAVTFFTGNAAGILTLRGLRGTIINNDNIYVGTVIEGVANGTPGDTVLTYTTQTSHPSTLGQVMTGGTSGAKRLLRGFDTTTATRYLVMQDNPTGVAGTLRDAYYKNFSSAENVTGATDGDLTAAAASTTLISGYNDITVAHINGTVTVSNVVNTFIPGEKITWNAGASSAIFIELNGGTTMTLGNVNHSDEPDASDAFTGQLSTATADCDSGLTHDDTEDFAFSLQSANNYSVFIEGGSIYNTGRSLSDIYAYLQYYLRDGQNATARTLYLSNGSDSAKHVARAAEEYIKSKWDDSSFPATKTAPFGTLAGSTFFGAQGVWLQGMQTSDSNNIKLTDYSGTLREPFTTITVKVTNTRADDRIAIYLEDGTSTLPDKDTYTSHASNNAQGDSTFERNTGAMPNDTPTAGSIVVVDASANEEHRYRFLSRNGTTDPGIFTLPTKKTGNVTTDTDSQVLISTDTTPSNFQTGGTSAVQVGDIIRRTNNEGGWAYVTSVDSTTQLTTTLLSTSANRNWDGTATADAYEINALVVTYTGSDTFFVPYLDIIEATGTDGTPGEEEITLTYVANREVVIEARNVKNSSFRIVPFKTTNTITTTGLTQSIIRTLDSVYA